MVDDNGHDNTQFECFGKTSRRDTFLATMARTVPWSALCEVIEPHDPKFCNDRSPVGLERMLRMYFAQDDLAVGRADPFATSAVLRAPCEAGASGKLLTVDTAALG